MNASICWAALIDCFICMPLSEILTLWDTEWWVLTWLSVWSEVQTCLWPSWCHCHSLSLASVKSRLVLPFWYWLTWVVPDKWPLNGCVCVCVWDTDVSQISSCNRRTTQCSVTFENLVKLILGNVTVDVCCRWNCCLSLKLTVISYSGHGRNLSLAVYGRMMSACKQTCSWTTATATAPPPLIFLPPLSGTGFYGYDVLSVIQLLLSQHLKEYVMEHYLETVIQPVVVYTHWKK